MPVIIHKTGGHRNEGALGHLIRYMSKSCYACYQGGCGIFMGGSESVIVSFDTIKKLFDKDDRKQVTHIIIGAAVREGLIVEDMIEIAEYVSRYLYGNGFQSYYVIHTGSFENPDYPHIHFAVNTVSFSSGLRYYENYANIYGMQKVLEGAFENYKWSSISDKSRVWEE